MVQGPANVEANAPTKITPADDTPPPTQSTLAELCAKWSAQYGPCTRKITVQRVSGKKVSYDERRNLSQQTLTMDSGDPDGNYVSIYLQYLRCPTKNTKIVCIDFDTKDGLDNCEIWTILQQKNCLTCETVNGYHCYVEMARMPNIHSGYQVMACMCSSLVCSENDKDPHSHMVRRLCQSCMPVDLITGDHCNVCKFWCAASPTFAIVTLTPAAVWQGRRQAACSKASLCMSNGPRWQTTSPSK